MTLEEFFFSFAKFKFIKILIFFFFKLQTLAKCACIPFIVVLWAYNVTGSFALFDMNRKHPRSGINFFVVIVVSS